MAPTREAVFATVLMNDAYLPGAMVLGHSLRDRGAKAKLVVLVVLDNLSDSSITELKTVYDDIVPINRIINKTPANLYLMDRPDLISTFTKIELWKQEQYRQIVYIDADAVCIRAPNELLNLDADFAAAPDIGWPDCFNSGVMVLRPSLAEYYSLLALAQRGISFDGADQGLLNMHFHDWERLSFAYNCTPSGNYQYVPAYRHFQNTISVVHFIGREKPWTLERESRQSSGIYEELLGRWWSVYDRHYRVDRNAYMSGQSQETLGTVQQYVKGEKSSSLYEYSSVQPSIDITPPPAPELKPVNDQSVSEISTATPPGFQQIHFSAPQSEWDASRAPPPIHSKPEASNFPTEEYTMSEDTKLFTPPSKYPEPPTYMWYQVPERSAEPPKLKPIFPWESHAPPPTRVFPDEKPPTPVPEPAPEPQAATSTTSPPAVPNTPEAQPTEDSSPDNVASPDAWQTYNTTNAWDEVPEIERYVQAFSQARMEKVHVLHNNPEPFAAPEDESVTPSTGEAQRRPSVKLTDFPTEIERPSLPVTPAPRRPSFWNEKRNEMGEFPAAEGVPKQEEWNPVAKLEELQRRHSEIIEKGPQLEPKELPRRAMPGSMEAAGEAKDAKEARNPQFAESVFSQATTSDAGKEASKDIAPGASTDHVSTTA